MQLKMLCTHFIIQIQRDDLELNKVRMKNSAISFLMDSSICSFVSSLVHSELSICYQFFVSHFHFEVSNEQPTNQLRNNIRECKSISIKLYANEFCVPFADFLISIRSISKRNSVFAYFFCSSSRQHFENYF